MNSQQQIRGMRQRSQPSRAHMRAARRRGPRYGQIAGFGAAGVLASIAGGIAFSAARIDHALPLPSAIDAERRMFTSPEAGPLSYYADETVKGRPLVLVHSINAAASAYEMRPLFQHYRTERPVYALDLPGFGFSDRSDRIYSPILYTRAILDFLRHIGLPEGGADVVALSLGSEFAARAAVEQPTLIRSLALISPSGFAVRSHRNRTQRAGESASGTNLHRLFSFRVWSQAFYDLLTSRPSIRYFLNMSFVGRPDPELVAYDYVTAHQPGARYAPLYFVSGQLFTPGVRDEFYERLTQSVLVLYDRDAFVTFDALPAAASRHPNWQAVRIVPSKGLPQFERLDETVSALDAFWRFGATAPLTQASHPNGAAH